jgi:aspartyl aminopeptidase
MIPDLEPHDDNDLRSRSYQNVLNQEELNPVVGSIPSATGDSLAGTLDAVMAEYKVTEEDIVSAELIFTPAFTPSDLGFDRGLVAAYGQDDRLSSYAGMRALISLERTPSRTAVVYWTNNEEVDSVNNTGAGSNWVEWAMQEIATAQTPERAGERARTAILKTEVISADTNAGMNPIFPSAQDPLNAARLGYGVTIKRYGRGFDAASEFTARFRKLFDDRGIPWQTATYRADLPGGGTVGLFFSARGMEVIDLGVPLLSMHAPVEASSKVDLWNFHRAMLAFLGQ